MKGKVAEALWESTFLTQILTLEWRSDAMCGKIRSQVSDCGWALSTGLYLTEWKYCCGHVCANLKDNCGVITKLFFHSFGHHFHQLLHSPC